MRVKQLEYEKTVMQRDIERKEARLEDDQWLEKKVGDPEKEVYESIKVRQGTEVAL